MIEPYPLSWPTGWPREQDPGSHPKFNATIFAAYRALVHELELLGARDIVVTSNALVGRNGVIASRQPQIEDTGVAVYFSVKNDQRVMCCDRWMRLEHNLRAIEKMVNALRGIERWGGRQMVDRSFQGMTALSAKSGQEWWIVLDISPTATPAEIDAAYWRLVKLHHPDAGGSAERFHAVQDAYRQARAT